MILVREKKFMSMDEVKSELLKILPSYISCRSLIENTPSIVENTIELVSQDLDINIFPNFNVKIKLKSNQIYNISRSLNQNKWTINYDESTGLTQRDLNMFLNC